MLDLHNKRIEELPLATARVPMDGAYRSVTGRVVAQTIESDPLLDIRIASGAIVQVRESAAQVSS